MANRTTILGNGKTEAVHSVEVHDEQPEFEIVPDKEIDEAARQAAFCEEQVTILLHSTTDDNAPPHVVVGVNGVNHPVFRGTPTLIKRKFVEVLARCKETRYTQPQRDMGNPEAGNQLVGRTALAYPFDLLEDKNPLGREWLNRILAEPA